MNCLRGFFRHRVFQAIGRASEGQRRSVALGGIFLGGPLGMGFLVRAEAKALFATAKANTEDDHAFQMVPTSKALKYGQKPLVVVGPSGVGKGTILRKLFHDFPGQFSYCISHTTRKARPGEVDGKNYYFVSKEEMARDIAAGLFVEHATFAGNTYGTSFSSLTMVEASGKVPVLEVDMQGAIQLNEYSKIDPCFCFIKPPSLKELQGRLRGRGTEDPKKIEKRLRQAEVELDFIDSPNAKFFQVVLVNDDLDKCYAEFTRRITDFYPHLKTEIKQ
mmetsp:Transcript_20043/g.40469  ORF Transcript_20043/g.40469 Transcript_20043/m.40469 type:complete len:276 (+) Transcript_20043:61-888(+)